MFRSIGTVVFLGLAVWGGMHVYDWYESRGPVQHGQQTVSSRNKLARNSQEAPDTTSQAVSMFRRVASLGLNPQLGSVAAPPTKGEGGTPAVYMSPWQNLEAIDYNAIVSSRCNHLDLAEYAFTDTTLAKAVAKFAQSGRPVRIYRDYGQFAEEQKREPIQKQKYEQGITRDPPVGMILNVPHISIRVKNSSVLMHLKAWSDGCILREGSANWSPSGEKMQQNTLTLLNDYRSVTDFEKVFEAMWSDRNNIVVQTNR
jgi:hypothetical protein